MENFCKLIINENDASGLYSSVGLNNEILENYNLSYYIYKNLIRYYSWQNKPDKDMINMMIEDVEAGKRVDCYASDIYDKELTLLIRDAVFNKRLSSEMSENLIELLTTFSEIGKADQVFYDALKNVLKTTNNIKDIEIKSLFKLYNVEVFDSEAKILSYNNYIKKTLKVRTINRVIDFLQSSPSDEFDANLDSYKDTIKYCKYQSNIDKEVNAWIDLSEVL